MAAAVVPPGVATAERGECMVTLADLLEAQMLTSDRSVASLLEEARDVFKAAGSQSEALQLSRRLRAMQGISSGYEIVS